MNKIVGYPECKVKCEDVVGTDDVQPIIDLMLDFIEVTPSAVGLAAPQLGINKKIIIARPLRDQQPLILLNPTLKYLSSKQTVGAEACFSVGLDQIFAVQRCNTVEFEGLSVTREAVKGIAKGFLARVLQHEVDHVNGICIPDVALGTVTK